MEKATRPIVALNPVRSILDQHLSCNRFSLPAISPLLRLLCLQQIDIIKNLDEPANQSAVIHPRN